MEKKAKISSLFLIMTLVLSLLITIVPVNAQEGVTQPVIPGFGVFLQKYSDYVPATYSVDPSTGKAVITKEGYEELHKWVVVRTYGQPFWEYDNSEGYHIALYYNARWKSNLDTDWQTFPSGDKYPQDSMDPWDTRGEGYGIAIGFRGIRGVGLQLLDPNSREIAVQVEALIGYYDSNNGFVGKSSGWSDTQTLVISKELIATTSPDPTMSPTPQNNLLHTSATSITSDTNEASITFSLSTIVAIISVIVLLAVTVSVLAFKIHRKGAM